MSLNLPEYSRDTFARRLRAAAPSPLTDLAIDALFAHYHELQRWAPIISLVGPGAGPEILQRHYGEALHALAWLDPRAKTLVDVGSGAGFPGFVLAAVRPDLEVTLVEPRERRWSFLCQAARRASLKLRCLNVRVTSPLPAGLPERIDICTVRALRPEAILPPMAERLASEAQVLLWVGAEDPPLPSGFARGRVLQFAGSNVRRLVEIVPLTEK